MFTSGPFQFKIGLLVSVMICLTGNVFPFSLMSVLDKTIIDTSQDIVFQISG